MSIATAVAIEPTGAPGSTLMSIAGADTADGMSMWAWGMGIAAVGAAKTFYVATGNVWPADRFAAVLQKGAPLMPMPSCYNLKSHSEPKPSLAV